MKKFLILSFAFFGLLPAIPAKANPVESCLNASLASDPSEIKSAKVVASVEHEGNEYHRIKLIYPGLREPELEAYIYLKITSQGGCEKLLHYLADSFPEEEAYREHIGPEVYQKFIDQARSQRI